jgi:hypothetical protein
VSRLRNSHAPQNLTREFGEGERTTRRKDFPTVISA